MKEVRIVSEEQIKNTAQMLDEKLDICFSFNNKADEVAYFAMRKTLEMLGFDIEVHEGKHTIHGNYAN